MTNLKPNQFLLDGHIITEIPLLCQTALVQALLEDRKTQTRRTRGLDEVNEIPVAWTYQATLESNCQKHVFGRLNKENKVCYRESIKSPYGKPGDLLWVREAWNKYYDEDGEYIAYKADDHCNDFKWKPSIHMPKAACRIWLMVDEIRVERLQDISEGDAVAEGVDVTPKLYSDGNAYFDYSGKIGAQGFNFNTAKESFKTLWESINGVESWNQNPWVWVVKFRTLSKTGRPSDELIVKNWKEVANG